MGLFGKKNKDLVKGSIKDAGATVSPNKDTGSFCELLLLNNAVDICSRACSVCWDAKLPDSFEERSKYIGKRTRIGHNSVTEHSNLVIYMEVILSEHSYDLAEFLNNVRFLHTKLYRSNINNDIAYLIIGGSWRGYSDLYRHNIPFDNFILKNVTKKIYEFIPSNGIKDIVDAKLLDESLFSNIDLYDISKPFNVYHNTDKMIGENMNCINIDDFNALVESLRSICPEPELFTYHDMLDFCTITIDFLNMSRIITQQLCRHRNGITQESQRYVNYSNGSFNNPAKFKPGRYDEDHVYQIKFGNVEVGMTLGELGDAMAGIYGQLADKSPTNYQFAVQYEDARGYLPLNIRCGHIYITFTLRNFLHFLALREDNHAQAEIRGYALELGEWFRNLYPTFDPYIIDGELPFKILEEKGSTLCTRLKEIPSINNEEVIDEFDTVLKAVDTHLEKFDEFNGDKEDEE